MLLLCGVIYESQWLRDLRPLNHWLTYFVPPGQPCTLAIFYLFFASVCFDAEPVGSRKVGEELGGAPAAEEGAYGYGGDGGNCGESQVGLENVNPKSEPENVHQIDCET